jgi:phosphatidyl-myo-inositol alpha-mannosyltransferase
MTDRPADQLSDGPPNRVAIFASSFHPHTGGVEELVRQLAHQQQAVGLAPFVYTMRWPKDLPATEDYQGIPVRRFVFRTPEGGPRRIGGAVATNPATLARLVDSLRRDRCDLIHVQCVSSAAWFAAQAARLLRLPLVVTLQGELTMDADHIFERSAWARRALRTVLRDAAAVTACSRATLDEAQSWFGTDLDGRGQVIPNGVRVSDFATATPHRETEPYLLAVGRHVPQKGFDVLIRAVRLLADAGDDPLVLLAGDGPERPSLERLVGELDLAARVRFLGVTDRERTASLFRGAAGFVLPSRHEPFGIVNLEAMAAGTPVIASRVGGVEDFVANERTGLLVAPEDPGALARAIRRLQSDPARRAELVTGGRQCAELHDWSAIEQQYRAVYRRVAAAGAAPSRPRPIVARGLRSPTAAAEAPVVGSASRSYRIAMTSYYLPSDSKIGAGHMAHRLAQTMAERGHQVTMFSPCAPVDGARYTHRQIPLSGRGRTFRWGNEVRRLELDGFEVLHTHGDDHLRVPSRVPAHVRTMHGSCFAEAIHIHGAVERVRMAALGLTEVATTLEPHTTVAVSENTRHWYPWIRRVIPNGVDLRRFRPGEKEAQPTLLFVGTYEQRKRGRMLMQIFDREIRPAIPDARLWMVCSDAPRAPGVEVLGHLGDDELADRYRRAWVFCLPSTYEGFGVPYIEAMASGTAVVATPNPGAREVLHGGGGVIAEDDQLGATIVDLLASPARRQELAEQGVVAARRYDWAVVAADYEALYARLLAGGGGPTNR